MIALKKTEGLIYKDYNVRLYFSAKIQLTYIIEHMKNIFPNITFGAPLLSSSMRPDGGILSIVGKDGRKLPVLITEVKNQGTNDMRASEGLAKQAQGNAIERLGKNVIGFRTYMLDEGIFPFVCFGYGCDFQEGSSILDRVMTIAMFGKLNETNVIPLGERGLFNRGSFYFRYSEWSVEEMVDIMYDIAERSIQYYFAKYGRKNIECAE
jgi:type II restriction enzyme